MSNELLNAALQYAAMGWHVFPLAPTTIGVKNSGKDPAIANGHLRATTDPAQITAWWSSMPNANIGVSVAPSGLVVLDVDIGEGKQGRASLAAIDAQLTPTATVISGSGGLHAIYERPPGMAPVRSIGEPARPYPHLDLIADGYVIAAPSLHWTGNRYRWHAAIPRAPMPQVLQQILDARKAHVVRVAASDVGQAKIPAGQGVRRVSMFRLGASIRATGVDAQAVRAVMVLENQRRFDPPLPDDELEGIVRDVMRHARAERDAAFGAVVQHDMATLFGPPAGSAAAPSVPECATVDELLPQMEAESKLPVAHLPFQKLDERIGGLNVHSTTLLVGGTGKGKTSLAGQIGEHHALNYGPVIVYVGEMTRSLWAARVASRRLKRSWIDVVRGRVPWAEVRRALEGMPILFVKRSETPVLAIAKACERTVQLGWQGIPMIVADYVQIMAKVGMDARLGVLQTVRELQMFVEECPVLALDLSQTSRAGALALAEGVPSAEKGKGKGAETSELENGATNELTISYASKDGATEHQATIILGKARFGGGDRFGFIFDGATGLWTPTDKPPVDEDHEERCAEILHHVMAHHSGRCMGGTQPCGRDLTVGSFVMPRGPHRIAGDKAQITRAIEDLIDMRRLLKLGSVIMPVSK